MAAADELQALGASWGCELPALQRRHATYYVNRPVGGFRNWPAHDGVKLRLPAPSRRPLG